MKQWELFAARHGVSVQALSQVMSAADLNAVTKAELLCLALPTGLRELARGLYRNLVLIRRPEGETPLAGQIKEELARLRRLELERSLATALEVLPAYSVGLEFTFTLARPYLSRDDDAFYIIDNPIRKDKVFKVPYLAPTSWKGSLRAAATRLLGRQLKERLDLHPEAGASPESRAQQLWPQRAQAVLLFGNENEVQARYLSSLIARALTPSRPGLTKELQIEFEAYLKSRGYRTELIEGRQGRLFFFPTFLNDLGLEIINPHDRRRRVGINPILYECVPSGAQGQFRLLYVPFDFSGKQTGGGPVVTPDLETLVRQVAEDLPLIAETVSELFLTYGFGAKTSSGYGVAADQLPQPGKILLKARLPGDEGEFCSPDWLKKDLGPQDSLEDFIAPPGELRSPEDYTQVLHHRQEHRLMSQRGFGTSEFPCLSELPAKARDLAAKLQSGGEK